MVSVSTVNTHASLKHIVKTEREMLQAMERISSGKRINNAGDDAAGAAISDRMMATVRALDMSIRNASDVLSMAQVAESAINEHSAALQRIRELSIQAATDILNAEQRIYLQTEANQLIQEMDRVARDTTFNEIAVLDGTFADRRFQIGSHEREKAVISVANMRVDKIGAYQSSTSMDEAGSAGNLASEGVVGANANVTSRVLDADNLTITGLVGQTTVDVKAGHSAKDIVELVNSKFDNTGVSATATTTVKMRASSSDAAGDHVVTFELYGKNTAAQTISATISIAAATTASDLTNLRDAVNAYTANTGIRATLSADKTNIILVQDEGEDIRFGECDFATVTNNATKFTLDAMSADQTDTAATSITTMVDKNHGGGANDSARFTGQITFHSSQTFTIAGNAGGGLYEAAPGTASLNQVGTIDIRTVSGAVDALKVIDRALDRVHMERAKFGAIMSRMNVVIDNLTNVSTNQKTSMSRITDANFAAESARLAKSQILQQSGMNMISEASRTMQNVLILFQ
ncbi:MAG: flagellin [Pseudomonadota bacterium]|nr:flagellin [Pseudomonadota bacterium]